MKNLLDIILAVLIVFLICWMGYGIWLLYQEYYSDSDSGTGIVYGPDGKKVPQHIVQAIKIAHRKTGVPKAYLLALLWQESKFGRDVGKPGRVLTDAPYQKQAKPIVRWIAKTFDLSADRMPGSIGGGAMWVAQIIPTTWAPIAGLKVIKGEVYYNPKNDQVAKKLGKKGPISPYSTEGSVMGAAIILERHFQYFSKKYAEKMSWNLTFSAYVAGRGGIFGSDGKKYTNVINTHINRWALRAAKNI